MPMKLGVKMVEANTSAINAVYMWFSCGARDRNAGTAALYYCVVFVKWFPCGRG
jgi:hypothetical protein